MRRPGTPRILQFTLTPEEMQAPSVERAFLVRPGIGYVRVASFDETTGLEIQKAIEKLGGDQLHGLVLDLRNNPGGLLTSAIETASLFLPPGLEDRDRAGPARRRGSRNRWRRTPSRTGSSWRC